MSTTAFAPVTPEQARRLRDGADGDALGPLHAHAAGPALREAHGLGASDDEEAGFVALGYAGLAALVAHPAPRLVLAVDLDDAQVRTSGDHFGTVEVSGLRWAQVTAVFGDEPGAADDLAEARRLVAGRSVEDVADDDEVVGLVDRWDLLWYAPEELDTASA
ncbi:hypothetical protein SAMN04488544_1856 [Microlunatus sagamiharensis]|uniref:Uncharacterized protein n=1 Tax=Microlunatus sagamiharensis TaxID=546874 RepID=A0A1H2MDV8_9ACTN|nr:hypothetical protein [Microlunatus sagamiharensis]SDU91205.1 hypothetical protein SAMN04488544_1856 [Microlunatus sagamiharensis]